MVSEKMVRFCNTFRVMVQAMLSVKLDAGGEAMYKFAYVPYLHFYVMSCGINMEGKYEGLQSKPLHYPNLTMSA